MPSFNKRHGRWEIRFKKTGRTPSEKTESLPAGTPVGRVRELEGEMNAAYHGGKWDPWRHSWAEYQRQKELDERGVVATSMTVKEAAGLYVKEKVMDGRIQSDVTRKNEEARLADFARFCRKRGVRMAGRLTPAEASEWLGRDKLASSTRSVYGHTLSGFYGWLVEGGFIRKGFRWHGSERTDRAERIKYLTEGQKDKMITHWHQNRVEIMHKKQTRLRPWIDGADLLSLLFYQGLRAGELTGGALRWNDISLADGTMRVTGKGNKTRTIPITPPVREWVARASEHLSGSDPVVPYSHRWCGRLVKGLAKGALGEEFKWVSMHTFRHSCGTYWVGRGVRLEVVRKLLGHSSMDTTLIYAKITDRTASEEFQSVWESGGAPVRKLGG